MQRVRDAACWRYDRATVFHSSSPRLGPVLCRRCSAAVVVLLASVILLVPNVAPAQQQEGDSQAPVFSGPQPGETMPPFEARGAFGKWQGESFNPVKDAAGKPLVVFFVHARTRPAFGLTRAIMRYAADRREDGLQAAIVFLSEDPTETDQWLRRIERYFPEGVPVGVSLDGQEGPGAYGLNRNVTLTVLVADQGKVTANFALVQPSLQADGPKIAEQIVKVLGGGKVPTAAELQGDPPRGAMRMNDPRAQRMLRELLRADATPEQVKQVAERMESYLKENADARRAVAGLARQAVRSGRIDNLGTPAAREYLKKWAGDARQTDDDRRR